MVITVKNLIKVEKAERLMSGQPTLAHFFTQLTGNSWELKHKEERTKALREVARYFDQESIKYTVE